MSWRLRITGWALIACIALCLMLGGIALHDALTRRPDVWWVAALFLIPSLVAIFCVYGPGGDE